MSFFWISIYEKQKELVDTTRFFSLIYLAFLCTQVNTNLLLLLDSYQYDYFSIDNN